MSRNAKLVAIVIGSAVLLLVLVFRELAQVEPIAKPQLEPAGRNVSGDLVAARSPGEGLVANATAPVDVRQEVEGEATAQTSDTTHISGRVIDALTTEPIAGAEVSVGQRFYPDYTSLDLSLHDKFTELADDTSDQAGRFRIEVPKDLPLHLSVRAPGHATVQRDPVFAGEDLEIRLDPGASIEGRITLARDGSPVAGVRVRAWERDTGVQRFKGQTDQAGFYRFEDIAAGVLRLAIEPETVAGPGWQLIEFASGDHLRRDFALEDGVPIHGKVTDKNSGEPIAGAEVGEAWTYRKSVFTDAYGEYVLPGFGNPGVYQVHARAKGYAGDYHEFPPDGMPTGATEVNFELVAGHAAFGVVEGTDGKPLEGVHCSAIAARQIFEQQFNDWESTTTDEKGRFEFSNLDVRSKHQILVRKEGYGTRVYDFPSQENLLTRIDLGRIRLGPAAIVRGTLTNEKGRPVIGHEVVFDGTNDDVGRMNGDGGPTLSSFYTSLRKTRTDSRGVFHFAGVSPGSYALQVRTRGRQEPAIERTVVVVEGIDVNDIELVVNLGEPVSGRVVAPNGDPVSGIFVAAIRAGGNYENLGNAESGVDGRFEFIGLPEGDFNLACSVSDYNRAHESAHLAPSAPVRAQRGDQDLLLELRVPVWLTGQVLDATGNPAPVVTVVCYEELTRREIGWVSTDANGKFEVELPSNERVNVEAFKPGNGVPYFSHPAPNSALALSVDTHTKGLELRYPE